MIAGADFAAVAFGLASAASWGAGDFSGGLATKRTNVFGVVIASQCVGLCLMILFAILRGEPTPTPTELVWGAASGLSGAIGLISFYSALASGRMGIIAPLTGIVTAAVPVVVGVLWQGLPGPMQLLGFGLAVIGVWLLARPEGGTQKISGIGTAVIAGLGFGGFLVFMNLAGRENLIFWPLAMARVASLSVLTIIAVIRREAWRPKRERLPLIAVAGIFDAGGNALFVIAGQLGRLDVASVLSSLYPAATVLLAVIILKERINRLQLFGILLVGVAITLIAVKKG